MNKKIIPEQLKKGDTIGLVCPSAGLNPKAKHRISNAQKCLKRMGYKVKLGNCLISQNYTSGSIEDRVKDIHGMFANPNIKAVMTVIGGNHSNHLLSSLDYSLIRKNPKIFIGYSDITVLHYAFYTQANLITYYGPCAATQFGEYPDILPYTKDSFLAAVSNEASHYARSISLANTWTNEFLDWFQQKDLTRPRKQIKNPGYIWLKQGYAKGQALPACNFSVNRLLGTKYWISPKAKILFLDLVLESLSYNLLDASLTDLFNAGVFNDINGLILSRLSGFSKQESDAVYQRILQLTASKNYPILANFDMGHTDPINTIQYDQLVEMDSEKKQILFY